MAIGIYKHHISQGFQKGHPYLGGMLGKKLTEESKKRMSQGHLGIKPSEETKRKMSEARKGCFVSKETRLKLSKIHKGKKLGYVPKSAFKKGFTPWNKGLNKRIDSRVMKISNSKAGKARPDISGEKCHLWKGGIAHKPYTVDWTITLKRGIRERDKYTCRVCGKEPAICVHHIDYNKRNCNSDNLITLCRSCHTKTNTNRQSWIKYFSL